MNEKAIKITFVDPLSNNEVEIITSNENAQRAENDADFANALFRSLRKDGSSARIGNRSPDLNGFSLECGEAAISESPHQTSTQENDGSLCRWTPACVMLLLDTYRKYGYEVSTGKLSNTKLCKKLADELQSHGFCVTGLQCGSKLRSLKKTYKSVKSHNERSPKDRRSWEFFDTMEELFGKKSWCKQVAIFSSNSFCSNINSKNFQKRKASLSNDDGSPEAMLSGNDKKHKPNDSPLHDEYIIDELPIVENELENDGSLYRWTSPCVWFLLEKYEKYTSTPVQMSNKRLCKKLSDELKSHGFIASDEQVSSKLRSLKKTYKSIKDHYSKRPYEKRSWEFFDKMEELFGEKARNNSLASFSPQNNTISEQTEDNPSTDAKTRTKLEKRSDATLTSLLKQRLQQKEAHEAQKAKRHADKKKIAETTLSTETKSGETLASLLKQRIQQKEEHEARKARRHKEKMDIAIKRLKMDEELLALLRGISSSKNV